MVNILSKWLHFYFFRNKWVADIDLANSDIIIAEIVLAWRELVPWANRADKKASFLMNVTHEEEFETPLDELRARLNIEVAPPFPTAAYIDKARHKRTGYTRPKRTHGNYIYIRLLFSY